MDAAPATENKAAGVFQDITRKYQYLLDKSSPHILYRWIFFVVIFGIYFTRVYLLNGWFIVTYALGIYLLNQLIGFLSPQVNKYQSPSVTDEENYLIFSRSSSIPKKAIWMAASLLMTTKSSGKLFSS